MATVTGIFKQPNGAAFTGTLLFRNVTAPMVDSPYVMVPKDVEVILSTTGTFSVTLLCGKYQIGIAGTKWFDIWVPDSTSAFDILDIITTPLISTSTFIWSSQINQTGIGYRFKNGYLQLFNVTTGLYHSLEIAGPAGMETIVVGTGEV
jgi:hypothetical protein